jgi:two-component system, response regulator / RNA-binding antiterminator
MNYFKKQFRVLLLSGIPVHVPDYEDVIKKAGHLITVHDVQSIDFVQIDFVEVVKSENPDVIILDIATPEKAIFSQLKEIMVQQPCPIIMFTSNDDRDSIEKAIESGIAAYVVKGWYPKRILSVIDTAIIRFKQMYSMQMELENTRLQLEDRKLIEKAKGIVMKKTSQDEETAYKSLRKMAMDQNMKLVDLARSVITASELLI